MPINWPDG